MKYKIKHKTRCKSLLRNRKSKKRQVLVVLKLVFLMPNLRKRLNLIPNLKNKTKLPNKSLMILVQVRK